MDRVGDRRGEDLTGTTVERFVASRRSDIIALVAVSAIGAWLIGLGSRFTFFYDEWAFVFHRELNLRSLLEAHNGHLSAIPALLYVLLLKAVGMGAYLPFRLLVVTSHLAASFGAYLVVSRRRGWPLGFVALVVLGLLGTGWQNILWSFQITMIVPVALVFLAIFVLQRNDDADWSVGAIVATSVLFSGVGVTALVAFAVHALLVRAWRRLAVLSGVGTLYASWLVTLGGMQGSRHNVHRIPGFVAGSAEYSTAGIGGRGPLFAIVVAAVLMTGLGLSRRRFRSDPAILVPVVALVVGWVLTAYSRADVVGPDASRYVYVGAAYIIVLFLVVVPCPANAGMAALLVPITTWVVLPNIGIMRDSAAMFTHTSDAVRGELAVIEAYGENGNDMYRPIPDFAPQVVAGDYLRAVQRYGSPAIEPRRLLSRSEDSRLRLDHVAFGYSGVGVVPSAVADEASCSWSAVPRRTVTALGSSRMLVRHSRSVTMALRMFASEASDSTRIALHGRGTVELVAPSGRSLPRWRLSVNHLVEIGICPALSGDG